MDGEALRAPDWAGDVPRDFSCMSPLALASNSLKRFAKKSSSSGACAVRLSRLEVGRRALRASEMLRANPPVAVLDATELTPFASSAALVSALLLAIIPETEGEEPSETTEGA